MKDFRKDVKEYLLSDLTPEERLKGLSHDERLRGLSHDELLKWLRPDERLRGLTPDEIDELIKACLENKGIFHNSQKVVYTLFRCLNKPCHSLYAGIQKPH